MIVARRRRGRADSVRLARHNGIGDGIMLVGRVAS